MEGLNGSWWTSSYTKATQSLQKSYCCNRSFLWPFLCMRVLFWVCAKWGHNNNNKSVLFLGIPPYSQNTKNYFRFSSTVQELSRRCLVCDVNAVFPGAFSSSRSSETHSLSSNVASSLWYLPSLLCMLQTLPVAASQLRIRLFWHVAQVEVTFYTPICSQYWMGVWLIKDGNNFFAPPSWRGRVSLY